MSDGKTHNKINLGGTLLGAAFFYVLSDTEPRLIATAVLGALAGTFFLSPDLDLKQSNSNKAWGGLGWLWYGYHRLFGHRKLSHFVVLGTLTRLVYLALIAGLLVFTWQLGWAVLKHPDLRGLLHAQEQTGTLFREGTLWLYQNQKPAGAFFVGLVCSDVLHLFTDLFSSFLKKHRRRKKRRA